MENLGILYFSSTGNSLYIAKKVKETCGGQVLYIPRYNGNGSEFGKIILVTPIYSFGLPLPVLDLLKRLDKNVGLIVIQNYGGMIGGADRLFYEYALKFGLNVRSVYALKMPENFTLVLPPPAFYKNRILKSADKRINAVIDAILRQKYRIPEKKRTREKTYIKNKNNWHFIAERFSVNDTCTRCGKCAAVCPVRNISFSDGRISFGNRCIACLGCFHRCPQKAIVYKKKSGKKQYVNPNINEEEIGKNL